MDRVVIVGAGPTGLLLAGDLARSGVSVTVVERLVEPSAEPKANAVIGQAARLLRHRSVASRLGRTDEPAPASVFQFGGLLLDLALAPGSPLHGLSVSQQGLERALAERAAQLGARIQRSSEVVDLVEGAEGVTVRVRNGAERTELAAQYVVGCDGAHSRVRELAGIGFPGVTDVAVVSRSAEVEIPGGSIASGSAELDVPGVGRLGLYRWNRTPHGAWSMLPRPSGTVLVSAMEWEQDGDASNEPAVSVPEVTAAFGRVLGADVPMVAPAGPGPHQLRRWRGRNTRIAEVYRKGRVLLAGDAAHVHNAVGAPGLNVGLQDAADLGWRLAGAVRGTPSLLGGYQPERRPAAERVALHTRAQTHLLSPGDGVTALRTLLAELATEPAVVARLADLLEGPDLRYPTEEGAHPSVGQFVPDLPGIDDHLNHPRPVLVDLGAALADIPPAIPVATLREVDDPPAAAMLVRPDGYVAWAADQAGLAETADLHRIAAALTSSPWT